MTDVAPAIPAFEEIRTCLAAAVEMSSLRTVARQVGVSPSGLQKTIDGAAPYRRTLRKYCGWWFAHGIHLKMPELVLPVAPGSTRTPSRRDVEAAVAQLREALTCAEPQAFRGRVRLAILALGRDPDDITQV
jgi:hypothetical protein